MESNTKGNGLELKEKALEYKYGQMEPVMKETGRKARPVEKGNLLTFMEMFIKANGWMIRLMDLVYTLMPRLVLDTKDIGKMICSVGQASKSMQMEIDMKACLMKEKGMVKENTILQMGQFIMVIG